MSVYISMAAFKHLIASFGSIKRRGGNSLDRIVGLVKNDESTQGETGDRC